MDSARPCSTASAAVLARWVVKTYTNCDGGFPETPPPPPPGTSGRRPGGGPWGGPGALLSLRGSWAVWPGPSCGAAMAGSATLQLWAAPMGLSSSSLSGPEHHSSPLYGCFRSSTHLRLLRGATSLASESRDGVPASRCSPESTDTLRSRFTLPLSELKGGTPAWGFFRLELLGEI